MTTIIGHYPAAVRTGDGERAGVCTALTLHIGAVEPLAWSRHVLSEGRPGERKTCRTGSRRQETPPRYLAQSLLMALIMHAVLLNSTAFLAIHYHQRPWEPM